MNRKSLLVNLSSERTYKRTITVVLNWHISLTNHVEKPFKFGSFQIQDLIYPLYDLLCMDKIMSDTRRLFSATNIAGYILGLLGISMIAVTQALTTLIPLLFAPVVCGVLGLVLYNLQSGDAPVNTVGTTPNAVSQK